jgi:hypothetical protein
MDLVCDAYPELNAERFKHHTDLLCTLSYTQIQDLNPSFDMKKIKASGQEHPHYMTIARFLKTDQSLFFARAFLFHEIGCNPYFSGDGYGYTPDGKRLNREFMIANCPVHEIIGCEVIDLRIDPINRPN